MALDTSIPARIVELIQAQDWPVGSHLPAQKLADLLRVSRSPINEALQLLHDKGLLQREPNRGHFGVRFHEALIEGSGNAFFIDTIRRVNRLRRLLSYRSMQDRKRYKEHARQHLHLLALLEKERNEEASEAMREHLQSTLRNITKIRGLLKA